MGCEKCGRNLETGKPLDPPNRLCEKCRNDFDMLSFSVKKQREEAGLKSCPECISPLRFIEDCGEGKTSWTCDRCENIVYIVN